jgi:hypothetical protein
VTLEIKGKDPLPGGAMIDHTWSSIRDSHRVIPVGPAHVLFLDTDTGEFGVYPFDKDARGDVDPFFAATSKGSWEKRGIKGECRLVWLKQGRLLEWTPTSASTSRYRLWAFDATRADDPIASDTPLCQGDWTSIGSDQWLLYLDQDWVLEVKPGTTDPWRLWRLDRNPKADGDPLPDKIAFGDWIWDDFAGNRIYPMGNDQVLIWQPVPKHHPELPGELRTRYRVYTLVRGATGGHDILSQDPISEGLYSSITDPQRFVFLGEPPSRALVWDPTTGRVREWGVEQDLASVTAVPGVKLRKVGAVVVLEVDVANVVKGSPVPSIAEVAPAVGLTTDQVLVDLCAYPQNEPAVKAIFTRVFADEPYPGFVTAGQRLKVEGYTARQTPGVPVFTDRPFEGWLLTSPTPLLLRQSAGFATVAKAASDRQAYLAMVEASKPVLATLRTKLDTAEDHQGLAFANNHLGLAIDYFKAAIQHAGPDAGILVALEGLLGLMLDHPKDKKGFEPDDRIKVVELRIRLRELKRKNHEHTVRDPVYAQAERAARETAAKEVLGWLEDPDLVAGARLLSVHPELDDQLSKDLHAQVERAYSLLMLTDLAEDVTRRHVEPIVEALALDTETAGLSRGADADFDAKFFEPRQPAVTKLDRMNTVLAGIARGAAIISPTIGNMPGPRTLVMSIVQLSSANRLTAVMGLPKESAERAASLSRIILKCVSEENREVLLTALRQRDMEALRKLDWTSGFHNSAGWSAALGLANLAVFCLAIQKEDLATLKGWSNLVSAGASTGGAAVAFASSFARFTNIVSKASLELGGKVLGVVGSVAAAVSGALSAIEAWKANDHVGFYLSLAGTVSSVASAAGFLILIGAGTSWAGVGEVLMLIGAVIAIGTAAASLYRDLVTAEHGVFESGIACYEAVYQPNEAAPDKYVGTYQRSKDLCPALVTALTALKEWEADHGWTGFFVPIDPGVAPQKEEDPLGGVEALYDLGFRQSETLAKLTGEDATRIFHRLAENQFGRRFDVQP